MKTQLFVDDHDVTPCDCCFRINTLLMYFTYLLTNLLTYFDVYAVASLMDVGLSPYNLSKLNATVFLVVRD